MRLQKRKPIGRPILQCVLKYMRKKHPHCRDRYKISKVAAAVPCTTENLYKVLKQIDISENCIRYSRDIIRYLDLDKLSNEELGELFRSIINTVEKTDTQE